MSKPNGGKMVTGAEARSLAAALVREHDKAAGALETVANRLAYWEHQLGFMTAENEIEITGRVLTLSDRIDRIAEIALDGD